MSHAPLSPTPAVAPASALVPAEHAPVFHAAGVEEMQTAGDVQRDLPAARRPGVLAGRVLGERPPQVTPLPQRRCSSVLVLKGSR